MQGERCRRTRESGRGVEVNRVGLFVVDEVDIHGDLNLNAEILRP